MLSGDSKDVGFSGKVDVFVSLDDRLIMMLLISVDIGEFSLCSIKDIFEVCTDCKLLFMFGRDILNISEYSNILCNTYCC
jgi:hypothetical protein